mmetsp:Transcript_377/g.1131  ORF Transcript_377/g.1131 Transcript_377/m.1131 type:complete len:208 (-) Transcript_377:122-745(-)
MHLHVVPHGVLPAADEGRQPHGPAARRRRARRVQALLRRGRGRACLHLGPGAKLLRDAGAARPDRGARVGASPVPHRHPRCCFAHRGHRGLRHLCAQTLGCNGAGRRSTAIVGLLRLDCLFVSYVQLDCGGLCILELSRLAPSVRSFVAGLLLVLVGLDLDHLHGFGRACTVAACTTCSNKRSCERCALGTTEVGFHRLCLFHRFSL